MACVKHTYSNPDCKWEGTNDKPSTPDVCPWCGWDVRHDFNDYAEGENDE